jgi:hypothetical protein
MSKRAEGGREMTDTPTLAEQITENIVLKNTHGVMILESRKTAGGHYCADNACCECGRTLMVAPPIFHPDHKKGDPVMVCEDHGVHAYRFTSLKIGQQPVGSAQRTTS